MVKNLKPLQDQGANIWCFGSRARGDHHKFSDLDLMIDSQQDFTRELGNLKEIFEESNLPIKIDVVQWKDFAENYKESYLNDRKKF